MGARRQLVDELVGVDTAIRQSILKEAGITPEISAGEGLAMKAELALPWERLRVLRRYIHLNIWVGRIHVHTLTTVETNAYIHLFHAQL